MTKEGNTNAWSIFKNSIIIRQWWHG
jgi:hypothetical protein